MSITKYTEKMSAPIHPYTISIYLQDCLVLIRDIKLSNKYLVCGTNNMMIPKMMKTNKIQPMIPRQAVKSILVWKKGN